MSQDTVRITVRLFASFRKGRFIEAEEAYPRGITVNDIATRLEIPAKDIGIIMVDGRHAALDHLLADGARLSFFPLLGGG